MNPSDSCALLLAEVAHVLAAREPVIPVHLINAARSARAAIGRETAAPRAHPVGSLVRSGERLAVLRWVARLAAQECIDRVLLDRFVCVAHALDWRQTYRTPDVEPRFLENYGWTELVGLRGRCRAHDVALGLLLLGPDTFYPPHRHEAEEIYLPLSGAAEWLRGAEPWQVRLPGELIHHASEELHAMRTGADPLLALYLWGSGPISTSARLVRGAA